MRLSALLVGFSLFCLPIISADGAEFPLDLSTVANMGFIDDVAGDGKGGWSDQGPENDMRSFDPTKTKYGGIEFRIVDPSKNSGKSIVTFDNEHARTGVSTIQLGFESQKGKGRYLYLLHTSCWNTQTKGSSIGYVDIGYEGGKTARKEVRAQIDLADWWEPCNLDNAKVVYRKNNGSSDVGVYLSRVELDSSASGVSRAEFHSYGKVVWILLGATISDEEGLFSQKTENVIYRENKEWKPVDLSDIVVKAGSALDISSFLEPGAAGKHGRVVISPTGRLAFADSPNQSRRFFGFNGFYSIMKQLVAPESNREELNRNIVKLSDMVRRQGYNIVRPQAFEMFVMEGAKKDNEFNPAHIDIVDRFLAELKARGVYSYLSIAAFNLGYKDVSKAFHRRNMMKPRMLIGDPDVRAHWQASAEAILNHVNPYTKLAWKDDPAIAIVEFYNEVESGLSDESIRKLDDGTRKAYQQKWQEWLKLKYTSWQNTAQAWGKECPLGVSDFAQVKIPDAPSGLVANDFSLFLSGLARDTLNWCEGVVRSAGYTGITSQYNHSMTLGLSSVRWEGCQAVSINAYFAHPTRFTDTLSRCRQGSSVATAAEYWRNNNIMRFNDRPFLITEHNHGFWNPYQFEDGLLFSAYSSLQDYSSVMIHEDPVALKADAPVNSFSASRSPVQRANEFIAACLYMRGDVRAAKGNVELQISSQYLKRDGHSRMSAASVEQSKIGLMTGYSLSFPDLNKPAVLSARTSRSNVLVVVPQGGNEVNSGEWFSAVIEKGKETFDMPRFVEKLRARGVLSPNNITDPVKGIYQSETEEITIQPKERLLKVITPMTEGVALPADKSALLMNLEVLSSTVSSSVAVCSIDNRPIENSARMVLVYATNIANTGMELSADHSTMHKLGGLPILMQTGKLNAVLRNKNAGNLFLYSLGIDGTRKEQLPLECSADNATICIDTASLKHGPAVFFVLIAGK